MNDLITINNGVALLDAGVSDMIADFERKINAIKKSEDALRERILEEMEKKGIKKVETDKMTVTYKAPYDKETFQSKEFRANHPDLYDEYIKITSVKSSVTIKLKEETE